MFLLRLYNQVNIWLSADTTCSYAPTYEPNVLLSGTAEL